VHLSQTCHIPANLLSLGALDFGMVVEGAVVMVENIVRLSGPQARGGERRAGIHTRAAHEVQRPVFYSIGIIITAYLPIFTLQRVEGRLFKPMAWTVAFALLGALLFSMMSRRCWPASFFGRARARVAQPADVWMTRHLRQSAPFTWPSGFAG
jgi:cobalt-zinc-cadmium resistance protein CzcA